MLVSSRKILLQGAVQGCGLRPALAKLALQHDWSGTVRNTTTGVELILQGNLPSDDRLRSLIRETLPAEAMIRDCLKQPLQSTLNGRFQIVASATRGAIHAQLPRDLAICSPCLIETQDPLNRRFRYPFTTCAECGPRFSILLAMPFDRERTTMRQFNLCPDCEREFHDPRDRRFHAQTISCPTCGPRLWLNDGQTTRDTHVLETAADALRSGAVVAMRGIGGYQLLADATSSTAVNNLRDRKKRPIKPLAVMVRSVEETRRITHLSELESSRLRWAANPIVLLRQRSFETIVPEVNPGLTDLGVLLPTTALHARLLELMERPLVCTSGNIEGEPLAFRVVDAESSLRGIADLFVHHDREITNPIDDSVVRVMAGQAVTIRAARGLAPLPLPDLHADSHDLLACGGQQKNAIALSNGSQSLLGPHLGDLDSVATQRRWEASLLQSSALFHGRASVDPKLACDAHPGYFATKWAVQQSTLPLPIWHHHAHVVAGMVEHGWLDREVLGVAWDGTGLGPDGTIWGGEFLLTTRQRFQRIACLRPFPLVGGESAIKDLRRLGAGVLSQLDGFSVAGIAEAVQLEEAEVLRIRQIVNSPYSPITTSCGRLFDVASLLIVGQSCSEFEGYAAMRLEAACDPGERAAYQFGWGSEMPCQLDWCPVIRGILQDKAAGVSPNAMAMKFHRALADVILRIMKRHADRPVVLAGGVFQNRVLVELIAKDWPADGPPLGLPGSIPPNDGGLAVGQLAIGLSTQSRQ